MEEAKTHEFDLAQKSPVYNWFWQSDPDPWKEKETAKWTWTAYPKDICYRIEEAALSKQPMVNLENYEIDLTKMLQINKMDRHKIRRIKKEIRCEIKSRFLTELELPKPLQQDEKTINHAFGHVRHFLNYMMKRTPAAYNLYKKLQDLHLDSEESEYKDITVEVICSIEKAAEQREKVIKSRIQNSSQNCILEAEKIVKEIRSLNSRPLRDFLKIILRLYTMETYLCYYLNELLRNEKWEELNVLTPYLVCLAYAFQIQEYVLKLPPEESKIDYFIKLFKKRRLTLYRGAALTEEHLGFYREMEGKHFSWNAVTSTSESKSIAIYFLRASLETAKQYNEKKVGVIFRIKTDFETPEDCEGMIDISNYSEFPNEKEVILAPGTVFELSSIKSDQDTFYEIKLRIKKKFDGGEKQIPLLGSLQFQVIQEDNAILDNLQREEFIKALQLLQGNKLVNKLRIKSCVIDDYLIGLIEDTRVTTNLKQEDVILIENTIVVPNLETYFKYFTLDSRLKYVLIHNQIAFSQDALISEKKMKICKLFINKRSFGKLQLEEFFRRVNYEFEVEEVVLELDTNSKSNDKDFKFMESIKEMTALKTLFIDCRGYFLSNGFYKDAFHNLLGCIRLLINLQSLSLIFNNCSEIHWDEFRSLEDALKMLTSLKYLCLDFSNCKHISDNGLNQLKEALKRLTFLQHLSLDFRACNQISDSGLNYLQDALRMLTSMQHLSLNFYEINQISDIGISHLKEALKILTSLNYLCFDFSYCNKISDNGLNHLKDALKILNSLQYLSFDFSWCNQISDNGFNHLKDALKMLTSLQRLSLNLSECNLISDNGLNLLKETLNMLSSLRHLSLNFKKCRKISDHGLNHLKDSLKMLTFLQYLCLDFSNCNQISDNGLNQLKDALKTLTSLHHLSLAFRACNQISDSGLNLLKEALKMLASLQHLCLDFRSCDQISDNGLNHLKDALKMLNSLQNLSLDFSWCNQISDNGLNQLKEALKILTSLQHLCLDFRSCDQISDNGLNHLKDAFKILTSLQHLSLDFSWCNQISDNGLNHLKETLKMLISLQHLSLDFWWCNQITNDGLNQLKDALKMLTSLQYLSLDFRACNQISDNGLNHLKDALKMLTSLQHLSVIFYGCDRISDSGLNHLKEALKVLASLQNLNINK